MAHCHHGRKMCPTCRTGKYAEDINTDNTGQVGIDYQGDLTMGIGGGNSIDLSDGSLVIGGIDTDGQ